MKKLRAKERTPSRKHAAEPSQSGKASLDPLLLQRGEKVKKSKEKEHGYPMRKERRNYFKIIKRHYSAPSQPLVCWIYNHLERRLIALAVERPRLPAANEEFSLHCAPASSQFDRKVYSAAKILPLRHGIGQEGV
jgi:hypothetical protein